ncbi:MAG: lysophospholipid acyltransferase family protein [Sedimenticola sp.]|nr:lysophospholipid acyltransferase family protein [Sedimenticola sp.]
MLSPKITHQSNPSGLIKYWVGRILLTLMGWKVEGELPAEKKFLMIGSPHTSNWDFPIGLATLYVFRLRISWVGKDTLFRWPFGGFMRWLGGIGVDRAHPAGVAEQLAKQLAEAEHQVLLITPSGTRGKRAYWKSGFYRIAQAAGVPIVCGSLDFRTKTARVGLTLRPTGNLHADMDKIRAYYADTTGKRPENSTPIRLREEDETPLPNDGNGD